MNTTAQINGTTYNAGDTINWSYMSSVPISNISFPDVSGNYGIYYNGMFISANNNVNNTNLLVDINKNVFYLYDENNNLLFNTATTPATFQSVNPIYLLAFDSNAPTGHNQNIKIYYVQIYDNDTLVRYLIPVNKNNIPCMYDFVSGNFFYNSCSGTFNMGQSIE